MLPEKRFYYFKTKANFEAKLATDEDKLNNGVCFIEDTLEVYTHGKYFVSTNELLSSLSSKQDKLTAGDNISISQNGDVLTISAENTTYKLTLNNNSLVLSNQDDVVISSIDLSSLSGGIDTIPFATEDTVGGLKLNRTDREAKGQSFIVDGENKNYQLVPSKGDEGDILTFNGKYGEWKPFNLLDLTTYGVAWQKGQDNPHLKRIGNMSMHRTLPIQSGMKGCVYDVNGEKVVYWLNGNDWRFRKDPPRIKIRYQSGPEMTVQATEIIERHPSDFDGQLFDGQYVRDIATGTIGVIETPEGLSGINLDFKIKWYLGLTPVFEDGSIRELEVGSVLSGYHGEVMVNVPEFWIKSFESDSGEQSVRISPIPQDASWEHQEELYVAAYKAMFMHQSNLKYLDFIGDNYRSMLGSPLSVANFELPFVQGYNGATPPEGYGSSDIGEQVEGKAHTGVHPVVFMHNLEDTKKRVMSYSEYKNIMFWLYVIEYANFNCFEPFTPELTADGFRKGGLGAGLSGFLNNQSVNIPRVIVPNGYTNHIGNNTGFKGVRFNVASRIGEYEAHSVRWRGIEDPFGHTDTLLMGVQVGPEVSDGGNIQSPTEIRIYTTNDFGKQLNYNAIGAAQWENSNPTKAGDYITLEFGLGKHADIFPHVAGDSRRYARYTCAYTQFDHAKNFYAIVAGGNSIMGMKGGIGSLRTVLLNAASNDRYGIRTVIRK